MKRFLIMLPALLLANLAWTQDKAKPTYLIHPYNVDGVARVQYHRTSPCQETINEDCYPSIADSYVLVKKGIHGKAAYVQQNVNSGAYSFNCFRNNCWETKVSEQIRSFNNWKLIKGIEFDRNLLNVLNSKDSQGDIPLYAGFHINFDINTGKTATEVTQRMQNWINENSIRSQRFVTAVGLMYKKNYEIEIVGQASNSWNGIDCSQYTTDESICDSLDLVPALKDGDFDGGGETNASECENGRSPIKRGDDVVPLKADGTPNISAATVYNSNLAVIRMNAAIQWFEEYWLTKFNTAIPPNKIIKGASGIANKSNSETKNWNQDQSIILRIKYE